MRDKSIKVVEKTNETLKENVIRSGNRLKEIVEETEKVKNKANREVKSYFDRHKIIDYLVYINLVVTPILFLIIIYIVFVNK
ncbi:MAG: hypothetical protein RR795_10155 [Cetobacterium sp.]|uniref:hypothetical protein n=1 Tax=Cetobacterium sp. TaxID=2071632 RepID=UPI002FC919EB